MNNNGTLAHTITIANSRVQNVSAVVQFTDGSKTVALSNRVEVSLNLTQPTAIADIG
ncbi:MAG TPA: hypothetical protein VIP70_07795 [Nitrososphaeraceae archaeon]